MGAPEIVPAWVRTTSALRQVAEELARSRQIAVDTEGDSLHHYPARLSLIQIANGGATAWLVDPLAIEDLSALEPVFGDPGILAVLHAGDNDLVHLKRRHGFLFGAVFDTSVAARFLGASALGLDVLLTQYLGVELPPSRQKDDWSARPLSPEQERYAAADVEYLLPLKDHLVDELRRAGRLAWVLEECEALARQPAPAVIVDPDAYASLKGARDLSPRGLAVLRSLYLMREQLARELDRPPFKIISNEALVQIAGTLPRDAAELARIAGFTPRAVARWSGAVMSAVARGLEVPESELPTLVRPPRPVVHASVRKRVETLRVWRTAAASRFALDPGVLLPNRLIAAIAEAGPRDLDALARVEGVRQWRVDAFGAELVAVIADGAARRP
jgi:ribonuclease D